MKKASEGPKSPVNCIEAGKDSQDEKKDSPTSSLKKKRDFKGRYNKIITDDDDDEDEIISINETKVKTETTKSIAQDKEEHNAYPEIKSGRSAKRGHSASERATENNESLSKKRKVLHSEEPMGRRSVQTRERPKSKTLKEREESCNKIIGDMDTLLADLQKSHAALVKERDELLAAREQRRQKNKRPK